MTPTGNIEKTDIEKIFDDFKNSIEQLNVIQLGQTVTFSQIAYSGSSTLYPYTDPDTYTKSTDMINGDTITALPEEDQMTLQEQYVDASNLNKVITAAEVKRLLLNAVQSFMCIRKITLQWLHSIAEQDDTQYTDVEELEKAKAKYYLFRKIEQLNGYAVLVDNIASRQKPDFKSLSAAFETTICNDKNVKKTASQNILNIYSRKTIYYKDLADMYDNWKKSIDANALTYTTYTCHWVCHANWSSSRSRR